MRELPSQGPTLAKGWGLHQTRASDLFEDQGFAVRGSRSVKLACPFPHEIKNVWPHALARISFLRLLLPRPGMISMAPGGPDVGGQKSKPQARQRDDEPPMPTN